MKEIIRSDVKIEQICNELDPFGKVDNKLQLLKRWAKFKADYEKIYGLNNSSLEASDILEFIKVFLQSNGEIENNKMKKILNAQLQEHKGQLKELKQTKYLSATQLKELQQHGHLSASQLKETHHQSTLLSQFLNTPTQATPITATPVGPIKGSAEIKEDFTKAILLKYPTFDTINTQLDEIKVFMKTDPRFKDLYSQAFDNVTVMRDKNRKCTPRELAKRIAKVLYELEIHYKVPHEQIGFGIKTENMPEYIQFGIVLLSLHKLYYHNILAVKQHNIRLNIPGFKNVKVSDHFVKIILNMLEKKHPSVHEINRLSVNEKQIYDRLIHLAHLNKMLPHTKDKTVSELKQRLKLIEGEIQAGNNSPLLTKELYQVVYSLKDFGILTQKDITSYLSQFK